ncbi:MAG: hypothetical protein ACYTGQ_13525 [Planctomycetota bacterium]
MFVAPQHIAKRITRFIAIVAAFAAPHVNADSNQNLVNGVMIMLNDNAGWCWYQDERALVDPVNGHLTFASVANYMGIGAEARDADIDVTRLDLATGQRRVATLSNIPAHNKGDDHNVAALWRRDDGRYIAVYTGHNLGSGNSGYGRPSSFYRITTHPDDPTRWGPERRFDWPKNDTVEPIRNDVTYSNLLYLANEGAGAGRLYNIARGPDRTPRFMYSDDRGDTWAYGGAISLTGHADQQGQYSNGYFKYVSNGVDRIDFIATEHHPRNFDNSIYHGYIQDGKTYNATGDVIDNNIFDETAPDPSRFTPVWRTQGVADQHHHHGWTAELQRDDQGNLYALITSRYGRVIADRIPGDADHRLFYARFDAATATWAATPIARMGGPLHRREQDYTGIGSIHPNAPNTVYISTPFNPRDNSALTHHEIFKGVTHDRGATWEWIPITQHSTVDNLRPIVPAWDSNNTALLWLRGSYPFQKDYDQTAVAVIRRHHERIGPTHYIDADPANTTLASGAPLEFTSGSQRGPADNKWHLRSGYGNSGSLFESNGTDDEDTGAMKMDVPVDQDGVYDIFAYFWANGADDWRLRASLHQNNWLVFRKTTSQQAQADHFDSVSVLLNDGGDLDMYRAYLGRTQLHRGETFSVYIDDHGGGSTTRTWFDGIGYARVLPVSQ